MTNLYNLFNFIEAKRPEYMVPFKIKLIYKPEFLTKDELTVNSGLDLEYTSITSLPDGLKVEDGLYLDHSDITSLPEDLTVGGGLYLDSTKITSLPDGLKVGGDLDLENTPLSKQYSKDEIRKMIQDKGGNVKGKIYI